MKIEHIGMWVKDIEQTRRFYETYFEASANNLYHNEKKGFKSYFLTFASGARVEIMHRDDLKEAAGEVFGYAHLAMSVGDKDDVGHFPTRVLHDGYELVDGPRRAGH